MIQPFENIVGKRENAGNYFYLVFENDFILFKDRMILSFEKNKIILIIILNTVPSEKFSALSKLKSFADDNFIVVQIVQSPFDRAENRVEKGENAFSPFPTMFSKGFFFLQGGGSLKVGIVW